MCMVVYICSAKLASEFLGAEIQSAPGRMALEGELTESYQMTLIAAQVYF
jgi:hypothetical protein